MAAEFWVGGHQEEPIKLDISLNEDTSQYITGLPDKIIVLIKYDKRNNIYNKMVRFIINNKNEISKQEYVYPNEPDVIEGDWNAYLAKYVITPSTDKCIKKFDDSNSSFFLDKIYAGNVLPYIDTLLKEDKEDVPINIHTTKFTQEGDCVIYYTKQLKTTVYKIVDKALKDGQSIEILGTSPFPVDVFYVGGDREPEEIKIDEIHYPSDKVFFYAKDSSEYYVICKNKDRLLGIKRSKEGSSFKFETSIANKPNILPEDYITWQSPLYNTWEEPGNSNNKYTKCADYFLFDSLKGYMEDPYFSVRETKNSLNKIDFLETRNLDINQNIKFTNTDDVIVTVKLKDLLVDDENVYKYPYLNINPTIQINKLSSTEEECNNTKLPDKKTKLKKLTSKNISKNQIKIIAASPIKSISPRNVRGTSKSSVKIKIRKISNS